MTKEMFRLDGKVALVTGAAQGIGAGIACALALQGADVALADRPGVSIDSTADATRAHCVRVVTCAMDVADSVQRTKGVEAAVSALGKIDILVNNAGINRVAPGLEVTEENYDAQFAVNVKGGFFLAQKVAPGMIERKWGRVIWISSQAGLVAIRGQPVYCATKGAVIQAVRTLGIEWAASGVTVNSVAPTFVATDLTRQRLDNEEYRNGVLAKIPCGRLATVDEVAAAVVFLASEEAAMVNCHTLSVDGGWTAW